MLLGGLFSSNCSVTILISTLECTLGFKKLCSKMSKDIFVVLYLYKIKIFLAIFSQCAGSKNVFNRPSTLPFWCVMSLTLQFKDEVCEDGLIRMSSLRFCFSISWTFWGFSSIINEKRGWDMKEMLTGLDFSEKGIIKSLK